MTSCHIHKRRNVPHVRQFEEASVYPSDFANVAGEVYVKPNFQPFDVDRADGFYEVVSYKSTYPFQDVVLAERPFVSTSEIKRAQVDIDEVMGHPVVSIELTAEGALRLENATEENIGRPLAIVVGGKVISMPVPNEKISGGKVQISGDFSMAEVNEMAKMLKN